jgi:MinD-like ATPase involved in chromosome partitioning or flagellar assembly
MSKIIAIHSFRGGTGKSNTTANLAAVLAAEGKRIGVVDTDIQSPGIHMLLGLSQEKITHTLNDYLWGKCPIGDAAYDVTAGLDAQVSGKIYLIPSSIKANEIARVLREKFDEGLMTEGFRRLVRDLSLDALLIDTHPGLNEETLLSMAVSNAMVIVMRPDQQDYEGTSVTVQVAKRLKVPRLLLIVNKVPAVFDSAEVKLKVEKAYGCEVGGVLPHTEEMMVLSSAGIFALRFPEHPLTGMYREVARKLMD